MSGENKDHTHQFTFIDNPTEAEISLIEQGLEDYNREKTDGEWDKPGIEIILAIKDTDGNVVGGINASTLINVMHLEALWVAKQHRKLGYARDLVLAAERIGAQKGCITSQTMSFSFQAPGFYQKIGYQVLGIYDGYPDGITEYVLMKRLRGHDPVDIKRNWLHGERDSSRFPIVENPTKVEMDIVDDGVGASFREIPGGGRNNPRIRLAIKDHKGRLIGGLITYTILRNMIVEALWLDEPYRGLGLGTKLMIEAERMAKENGCIASQAYSFSFQAPEFFQRLGYKT